MTDPVTAPDPAARPDAGDGAVLDDYHAMEIAPTRDGWGSEGVGTFVNPIEHDRAAVAAVAPDLDRAGYDRARRECADELRAELRRSPSTPRVAAERAIKRWSPGRAPAGEEEQR